MRFAFPLVAAVIAACSPLAPALAQDAPPPPATAPAIPLPQLRAEQEQRLRAAAAETPLFSPTSRPVEQVIALRLVDGLIDVDPTVGETDGFKRVAISDIGGLATINASTGTPESGRPSFVDFNHVDFNTPGAITHSLQVFARGDYVQIAWDESGPLHSSRIQLIQAPQLADDPGNTVRLYYDLFEAITEEQLDRRQLSAESFDALWRDHRADVGRLVIDPLRRRGLHAGLLTTPPSLGWQVLGTGAEPPAAMKQKVSDLVKQLDAEAFADREAAAESLRQMGSAAAVALRSMDAAALSEEQRRAVDAIVAKYSAVPDEAAGVLARDPAFLIGCLYSDDAALWPLAADALSKATGAEVNLDGSPASARREADRLLDTLILAPARSKAPQTRPTTRPEGE